MLDYKTALIKHKILTKDDRHLPEIIGKYDPELKIKRLLNKQERRYLEESVMQPLYKLIRQLGEQSCAELVHKLGCWLVIHDPDNTCLLIYLTKKEQGLINYKYWKGR